MRHTFALVRAFHISDHSSEVSPSYDIFSRMAQPIELTSSPMACAAVLRLASWGLAGALL